MTRVTMYTYIIVTSNIDDLYLFVRAVLHMEK